METGTTPAQTTSISTASTTTEMAAKMLPEMGSKESTQPVLVQATITSPVADHNKVGEPSLTTKINAYQRELEAEFKRFEESLSRRDTDHGLETMDWDDLEERYKREMSEQNILEQEIMDDFAARFKQFTLWMQVSNQKDSERALKRLRTRTTFVQNSENELSEKQEHYAKVLAAFHEAMALLGHL